MSKTIYLPPEVAKMRRVNRYDRERFKKAQINRRADLSESDQREQDEAEAAKRAEKPVRAGSPVTLPDSEFDLIARRRAKFAAAGAIFGGEPCGV